MTEYYLRGDMATGELAAVTGAADLLRWGARVADSAAPGDVYRHREGRKTLRCHHDGRPFFLKLHRGIGWGEIAKNLLQLRLPVLGAKNEYRAVTALENLGVDTLSVAAYACAGHNPAALRSLLLSDELVGTVSLEDYCADWANAPPPVHIRLRLLRKLANTARRMHGAGINHRDFYLCHFHLDPVSFDRPEPRCHLIDLHRAQLRRRVPRRWRIKDLAGLYFSAMDCGLSSRDLLRFMRHYSAGGLRRALGPDAALWAEVARRAARLYCRQHGAAPPAPPGPPQSPAND